MLVVDCRSGDVPATALAVVCGRLADLPGVSVAIAPAPPPAAATFLDTFDVVVASEGELAPIVDAVRRAPLAATTLVRLLRHNAGLGIQEGLVAESLAYSTLQGGPEFAAWLAGRDPSPARPEAAGEPPVIVRRTADRLDLVLNRPARRNALSIAMRDALVEALRMAASDAAISEIGLSGNGPAFCAGGELDEFGTLLDPATAHAVRMTRSPAAAVAACGDRLRVEVHGACVGAGAELPAFARRVVARRDAFFQLPEVRMGLVPGAGGTVGIPRRVGRQRTAGLCLSGVRLDAETALAWGLVDEVR